MIQQLFTVFDSAANAWLEPFFAPTLEVGLRMFREICNKPDHQFAKYPEDYTLFHIGSFSQASGVLEPLDTPHSLGVAITFIDRKIDRHAELMAAD